MALQQVPTIPETITVHLGLPNQPAENVTVPFPDYIKNVASSEIYPTWPEAAIRANIYAQITYALNRIFNEFYRSQGILPQPRSMTRPTSRDGIFMKTSAALWMKFSTTMWCGRGVLTRFSPPTAMAQPPSATDFPNGRRLHWRSRG